MKNVKNIFIDEIFVATFFRLVLVVCDLGVVELIDCLENVDVC